MPARLPLLVALFGAGVLWSADPALARAVGAPLHSMTAEFGYVVAPRTRSNNQSSV